MDHSSDEPTNVRRLADVVRKLKIADADRSDVVVDMKEADRARLEILAQELAPVFEGVPDDDERFDFALSSGLQPRLWIDATAHVMMGRDRRVYRFVRDTRIGREVLAESTDTEPIAERVTTYIAERLLERERAMTDGTFSYRRSVPLGELNRQPPQPEEPHAEPERVVSRPRVAQRAEAPPPPQSILMSAPMAQRSYRMSRMTEPTTTSALAVIAWIVLGMLLGGALLMWLLRETLVL